MIEEETGRKYCPILFSDLIGGEWNAKDLETSTGKQDSPWAMAQVNKEAVMAAGGAIMSVKEEIVYLPLSEIHASDNQRKTMDPKKFEELKASIKERGVETPVWVRKNGNGFLLIAGSRRFRACKELGKETIPAIVKEVTTDQDALILSCIENDQREDVNPMEQALAYQDALNKGSHTPETLAERLCQKLPYVLGRLKLLKLSKKSQKALQDEKIEYGHALLISRLKDHKDQDAFLEEIFTYEFDRTMTVKESSELLDNYSTRLAAAAFDAKTVCASCSSRSRTQAVLFPELAKKDDECMNKSCFEQKTKEHYEKLAKELEAKGLKVLKTEKEFQSVNAGRNCLEISPDPERDWEHPKKYKTMCATCEKRAFFNFKAAQGGFRTGELCLDKKCFNQMNGKKETSSGGSSPAPRSTGHAKREHALAMRDRFLRSRMPAAVEKNETLQRRLALFHFLFRFDGFSTFGRPEVKKDQDQTLAEILREHCPGWKHEMRLDEQKLFAAVQMIPSVSLDKVLRKAVLASVPFTDPEVLLQGMDEAGVSFEKDFQVDEAFLNTKTKGALVDLAVKNFGLPKAAAQLLAEKKKPDIVKGILSHNLVGKVPADISKECKVVTLGGKRKA